MIASFYVDTKQAMSVLRKSRLETKAMLQEFVGSESGELLGLLKEYAPKKTGKFAAGLRRHRSPASMGQNRAQIDIVAGGTHGFLGKLITRGTKPHVIRSSRPMPISYEGEACRFAYTVNHPGTKANDFVQRAMRGINRRLGVRAQSRVRRLSMVRS